ncbi:MAG: hypothetical protein HC906_11960 [Bacteroidales bacterium]|nr:hypothetical protein [Bacteroidales bacterium]
MGGGINILDLKTRQFGYIKKENKDASLSTDHIYTIYFDDKNALWVGTFGEGILYYDPGQYKFGSWFNQPGDLEVFSGKSVLCLYQDHKESLWVGTDGDGLYRITPDGRITVFNNHNSSLSTNVIASLNEDSKGNILIGTYSGGLNIYNPEQDKFTHLNPRTAL